MPGGAIDKTLPSHFQRQNGLGVRLRGQRVRLPSLHRTNDICRCGELRSPERAPRVPPGLPGARIRLAQAVSSFPDSWAHSTFTGCGASEAAFATCAAWAMPASAAIFFCWSEPGCTTPADMIKVAASSADISTSMTLLLGT